MKGSKYSAMVKFKMVCLLLLETPPVILSRNGRLDRNVRVTMAESPLVSEAIEFDPSGKPIELIGLGVDHLVWLSQKYKFNYTIERYYTGRGTSVSFFGRPRNGSWDGMIGDLTNDAADLAVGIFSSRRDYIEVADLTFPWVQTSHTMVIPYPEEDSKIWSFVKPFSFAVWIVLLASFLIVSFTLWAIIRYTKATRIDFGSVSLNLLAILIGQGGYWKSRGRPLFVLGITWSLVALVIANAYNGLLITYLTVTEIRPIVTTLEDLAAKPDVKFYANADSYFVYNAMAAVSGSMKTLGNTFKVDATRQVPSIEKCVEKVEREGAVCIIETNMADAMVSKSYKAAGNRCTITTIDRTLMQFGVIFVVKKSSPWFPTINEGLIVANAMSLLSEWKKKQVVPVQCQPERIKSTKAKKLSLGTLQGPFVILFIGCTAASIAFVCELLTDYVKRKGMQRVAGI